MNELPLMIPSDAGIFLEARYAAGTLPHTAILCHPHPLYGGHMDNNVVTAVGKALYDLGWGTIRFNFRGVGRSGGSYGDGEGEEEDLRSVVRYVQENLPSSGSLCLAGYSFGAWIALRISQGKWRPDVLLLLSPPVDFLPFDSLRLPASPCLVVTGENDDFCSVTSMKSWLAKQGLKPDACRLEIMPGADHFYWGHENRLAAITKSFFAKLAVF